MNGARPVDRRPSVEDVRTEHDLRRWYWLCSELVAMARLHSLPTSGGKVELTERLADFLAGREPTATSRRKVTRQFVGPLEGSTVLPVGQRCSQELRQFLRARIGATFRFDGAMRDFIASGGVTADEVVDHWYQTRDLAVVPIGSQFEYNRFTRAWRAAHPEGDRADLLEAWWAHRNAPRS